MFYCFSMVGAAMRFRGTISTAKHKYFIHLEKNIFCCRPPAAGVLGDAVQQLDGAAGAERDADDLGPVLLPRPRLQAPRGHEAAAAGQPHGRGRGEPPAGRGRGGGQAAGDQVAEGVMVEPRVQVIV